MVEQSDNPIMSGDLIIDNDPVAEVGPTPMTAPTGATSVATAEPPTQEINRLNDVEVTVTVELGRTELPIREVLKLRRGSVVELEKLVGQPADLLINNTLMAKGEVIVINERFGFRVTKFVTPAGS
jgi:flagellar motor switch protein FliN/FliY